MGNDLFTQVVAGASRSLAESSYQLMITPTADSLDAASVLDAFVDRQMDGIITVSYDVPADLLERVAEFVPIVVLGRHDASQAYDTVTGDDVAGTDLVMDHLLELGHRSIAHLTIQPTSDRTPQAIRTAAYSRRMEEAGLVPQVVYGGESEPDAYASALSLLAGDESPTATLPLTTRSRSVCFAPSPISAWTPATSRSSATTTSTSPGILSSP